MNPLIRYQGSSSSYFSFIVCCLITGIYWLYAFVLFQYDFQVFIINVIEFFGPFVQVLLCIVSSYIKVASG